MLKPRDSFAKEYHLKKCIDVKGLAEVWEVASVKNHIVNSVALKIFPWVRTAGIKEIEAAFAKQPYFDHSNLLSAKRLGIYNNRPFLEMHFCNNGNISRKVLQLNESEIIKAMHQISSALAYLHDNSIIHGCIKPDNILIDGNSYYLYLADLGLSRELRETIESFVEVDADELLFQSDTSTNKGPARSSLPCFCAPELFENNPEITSAADIWALGASMFEMITGKLPFGYLGGEAQQKNNAVLKDIQQTFSVDFNSIIKRCLSKNKDERPTAQEIEELTNGFLKGKKNVVAYEAQIAAANIKPASTAKTVTANVEPTKPEINVETAKPLSDVEPAKPIVAIEPDKPIINNEVENASEPINTVANSETKEFINAVTNPNFSVDTELPKPIANVPPTIATNIFESPKPELANEPVNATSVEKTTYTDNAQIKPSDIDETINPTSTNESQTPPADIEPKKITTADEAQTPATSREPLKEVFFATARPAVIIKNVQEKKEPIKLRTVLNFVVPSLVVGSILFIYIKMSPDQPDYTIIPVSKYSTTPPLSLKKGTGDTIKNQPNIGSLKTDTTHSKVHASKLPVAKKTNLPAPIVNPSATIITTTQSSNLKKDTGHIPKSKPLITKAKVAATKPAVAKNANVPISVANKPATIQKVTQNKPVIETNGVKISSQENNRQTIVPKAKKQKSQEKVVDRGIPKHKDTEQTIDHDSPKRKN